MNRDADRVRVTAQLIDSKTDEHVWARSYDRTIRDVLSLQAAVAAAQREFQRAIELNPHYPTARQWYAIALSENGQHAEAKQHAEEAVSLNPLDGVMH